LPKMQEEKSQGKQSIVVQVRDDDNGYR